MKKRHAKKRAPAVPPAPAPRASLMAVPPSAEDVKGATAYDRLCVSAREALTRRPLLPWETVRARLGL